MFYLRTNTGKLIRDDLTFCDCITEAHIYYSQSFAHRLAKIILLDHPDLTDIAVTDLRSRRVTAMAWQPKVSA